MSFGLSSKCLPEKILRLLSPEDRRKLGRGALTADEALAAANVKSERALQDLIENYLRLRGIEPIRSRMDKKTTTRRGTPDFLFAVLEDGLRCGIPHAIALEVKTDGAPLEPEQLAMRVLMTTEPNGWSYFVVRSLDDVREILDVLGI